MMMIVTVVVVAMGLMMIWIRRKRTNIVTKMNKDDFMFCTVHGGCIHGSPSICMGNLFLVLITTDEHCASRRPEALSPVLTCPMCRQFSSPMTSMRRSPMSKKHSCKKANEPRMHWTIAIIKNITVKIVFSGAPNTHSYRIHMLPHCTCYTHLNLQNLFNIVGLQNISTQDLFWQYLVTQSNNRLFKYNFLMVPFKFVNQWMTYLQSPLSSYSISFSVSCQLSPLFLISSSIRLNHLVLDHPVSLFP